MVIRAFVEWILIHSTDPKKSILISNYAFEREEVSGSPTECEILIHSIYFLKLLTDTTFFSKSCI